MTDQKESEAPQGNEGKQYLITIIHCHGEAWTVTTVRGSNSVADWVAAHESDIQDAEDRCRNGAPAPVDPITNLPEHLTTSWLSEGFEREVVTYRAEGESEPAWHQRHDVAVAGVQQYLPPASQMSA